MEAKPHERDAREMPGASAISDLQAPAIPASIRPRSNPPPITIAKATPSYALR